MHEDLNKKLMDAKERLRTKERLATVLAKTRQSLAQEQEKKALIESA